MKISIEELNQILAETKVDPETAQKIVSEAEALVEEKKSETSGEKKTKNQFIVVAVGADEDTKLFDATLHLVQVPSSKNQDELEGDIELAIKAFNGTKKGSKKPIKFFAEAFEIMPRRHFKEIGIQAKTKSPVIAIKTKNAIN